MVAFSQRVVIGLLILAFSFRQASIRFSTFVMISLMLDRLMSTGSRTESSYEGRLVGLTSTCAQSLGLHMQDVAN